MTSVDMKVQQTSFVGIDFELRDEQITFENIYPLEIAQIICSNNRKISDFPI